MSLDKLYYDVFPSALGWWGAAATSRGLYAVSLPRATARGAVEKLTNGVEAAVRRAGGTRPTLQQDASALAEVRRQVEAYARNPSAPLEVLLDLEGFSPFARAVIDAARAILPGEVLTYAELASRAGRPGGARAIGQAMHGNRLPLFIPCHRVVASGGHLGGFGDGLAQKVRLLVHEGALAPGALRLGGEPIADAVQRVRRFLRVVKPEARIIETAASTRTAPEAAAALGVEVGQIAKSLLFMADGRPVLVVTSGDRRVNQDKLRQVVGADRISLADPKTVAEVTGFPVGGVAPVAHLHPAQVVLDVSMKRFPVVYAAAGTPASAVPLPFAEWVRVSGGEPADVC
ncbi:MAG: methylated-DNA--[protein]-cysteine S-methyltransferase [Bacillota bacterium]|nr:methylated-DNA--[protein]-cysteine S-methyltransferase [Bacillota bacterium]